jgi:DNA polymerase I
MVRYILDLEANGLLDTVTKIWCVVLRNVETGTEEVFTSRESFSERLKNLEDEDLVVGHNILGFDLPALKKVWDIHYSVGFLDDVWHGVAVTFIDTFHLSQFLNVERDGHSLEDWGKRLGFPKGEFNDWSKLSPEMIEYCKRDCELNQLIYEALVKEIESE